MSLLLNDVLSISFIYIKLEILLEESDDLPILIYTISIIGDGGILHVVFIFYIDVFIEKAVWPGSNFEIFVSCERLLESIKLLDLQINLI
jgi:hypothetical protein